MSISNSSRAVDAVLTVVVAIAVAVAILGTPVVLLVAPPYTRLVEPALVPASATGLDRSEQIAAAELVRRFVAEADAPALPAVIGGRSGFDRAAVAHLLDVRRVVIAGRRATLLALAVLALAAAAGVFLHRWRAIGSGLLFGAVGLAVLVAAAAVFAVVDFDAFFSAFHGLFFSPGTWLFPYDSLLIQLFPERFWALSGVAWAVLSLMLATASIAVGAKLRRRRRDQ